jgi:Domain of unknown function (DUF3330)
MSQARLGMRLMGCVPALRVLLTRSVTMAQATDSKDSCAVCEHEVPLSEAPVREASDYMAHYCGLDCYDRWRKLAILFVSTIR